MPAMVKRIVLIDTASVTASVNAEGFMRRMGHIDLRAIANPKGLNRLETVAKRDLKGIMTFGFFTMEGMMKVDDTHILVGNDNYLPFSSGRKLDAATNNEMILLEVPEFLAAK